MKLDGKVALVTGGGSGMGRAISILFAREGAKVSIVDIDQAGGQETAKAIEQDGGRAKFISADVAKAADVEQAVKITVDNYSKLDILVNNAGVPMRPTPIEEIDEKLWDNVMAINMKGVFLFCKYATPIIKKQGAGVIINVGSIAGVRPRPAISAYNVSKAGVITLTQSLALELAPYHIRVNCINPVATDTPMFPKFRRVGVPDQEARQAIIATIPLGRLSKVEDIASAALFLASDESAMVTGISLNVDGGRGI